MLGLASDSCEVDRFSALGMSGWWSIFFMLFLKMLSLLKGSTCSARLPTNTTSSSDSSTSPACGMFWISSLNATPRPLSN